MNKRILAKVIVAVGLLSMAPAGCAAESATPPDADTFRATVLDTGKSDAIILETAGHTVLIDTGYEENGPELVERLREAGIERLDYLIITHFDKDHVGGADAILRGLAVENVVHPAYEEDSKQYRQYTAALQELDIAPIVPQAPLLFALGSAAFTLYPPEEERYKNENNYSLVTSVEFGQTRFLFTGDAMSQRIRELLEIDDLAHNFLKVPHHGDFNKRSEEFFQRVSPEYAVITCSLDDPADPDAVAALERVGAEVFLTVDGAVSCTSDGVSLRVEH